MSRPLPTFAMILLHPGASILILSRTLTGS